MKKNATVLVLGLVLAGAGWAKDQVVSDSTRKDGASATPQGQTVGIAARPANATAKASVAANASKDGTADPYKVPLLRDARPLR